MIEVGARVPAVEVLVEPGEDDPVPLDTLAEGGPFLLLFYIYDWTST